VSFVTPYLVFWNGGSIYINKQKDKYYKKIILLNMVRMAYNGSLYKGRRG